MTRVRSEHIDALLAEQGTPDGWSKRASVHPCVGARFHSPSPLVTRRHEELSDVWLCPTCTENLACFVHLARAGVSLDWPVLREFGNLIRALGQRILSQEASA